MVPQAVHSHTGPCASIQRNPTFHHDSSFFHWPNWPPPLLLPSLLVNGPNPPLLIQHHRQRIPPCNTLNTRKEGVLLPAPCRLSGSLRIYGPAGLVQQAQVVAVEHVALRARALAAPSPGAVHRRGKERRVQGCCYVSKQGVEPSVGMWAELGGNDAFRRRTRGSGPRPLPHSQHDTHAFPFSSLIWKFRVIFLAPPCPPCSYPLSPSLPLSSAYVAPLFPPSLPLSSAYVASLFPPPLPSPAYVMDKEPGVVTGLLLHLFGWRGAGRILPLEG